MSGKPLRCTQCGSSEVVLLEHWTAWVEFDPEAYEVRGGTVCVFGGGVKDIQDPTGKVSAHCIDCDHWWTLRRKIKFQASVPTGQEASGGGN